MATWRSTAATFEMALSSTLKLLCFSAKKREQCTMSPIGAPRISKLGKIEDLTEAGESEIPFLLNTSHLG